MPPAACHSPPAGQPSPADEAPPPGRAWNMCQMNERPLRGSVPWIAMRNRRPHPAITRSGHAGASARMIASMISCAQWLVARVTARALARPDHGALLRNHFKRAERAVVLRGVGVDEVGERHRHRGAHVRVRRVDEPEHLRVGVAQIDAQIAAAHRHPGADVDVVEPVAVVVEMGDALVLPVRPLGDDRAGLALGAVEHRFDRGAGGPGAELGEQRVQPPFADPGRADHRRHVAAKIPRMAHVEHDHLVDVLAQVAPVVEP